MQFEYESKLLHVRTLWLVRIRKSLPLRWGASACQLQQWVASVHYHADMPATEQYLLLPCAVGTWEYEHLLLVRQRVLFQRPNVRIDVELSVL